MMIGWDVEAIVEQIRGLPRSTGPARDAVTLVPERLHLARSPEGAFELFIEGTRASFGKAAVGRALEFGDFEELKGARSFSALLVRSPGVEPRLRPMAHIAYEALRALHAEPGLSNEELLGVLGPYLGLVIDRELLSIEQQLGLLGEMIFLGHLMNRADELGVPTGNAVRAWTGWDSASRDFAASGIAVEAKTTRSEGRVHWIHPMYQLLPAPGEQEEVYLFSVGVNVDRSRDYRLVTAIDRVLERVSGIHQDELRDGLRQYAGVGFDEAFRRQYELEPGFLVTQPPALIRVDQLTDVVRPESFIGGQVPGRVSDLRYLVDLEGLPVATAEERNHVIDSLLGATD